MSISNPNSSNDVLNNPSAQMDNTSQVPLNYSPHPIRLRTKLTGSFIVLTILATIVLTVALYINMRGYVQRATQQRLLDVVSVAALQVNADANASLKDPEQEGSAEYLQIKRTLQRIRDSSTNIRYVYTARYSNHQEIFIVDAETDPTLVSHLGTIYGEALPSALSKMENTTTPYVEPQINTDQWGTWITSCAPIFLSDGTRGDFLCIDMSAKDMLNQERQFLWIALAIFVGMLPFVAGIGWWMGERLAAPLAELIGGAQRLAEGDLQHRVYVSSHDETAFLAQTINNMADRMNNTVATLEQQIIERTREVERRSTYLAATAEVGKVANTILDADQLVQQVIELIQKQFDLYYVGLFQISEDGKWAVLRAGTGEVGRNLVARQHRIAAGEGMIGWCIANGQARVAHEVSQEPNRLEIPELPKTQSEAALPLFTRGRIIGALTVQSERIKTFDETMMVALQTMADQVAITLDNARLFAEGRNALSTDQKAYAEKNQTDWLKTFSERSHYGYYADHEKIEPLDEHNPGLDLAQQDSQQIFHLPIRVRGQVLGTIHARKADTAGAWNPEESALLETLTDQLSIALDNARLYQDTQRRAARDRMVAEISNKMRRAVDMDTLIQTAVREITNAIKVPEAFIQLGSPPVEQDQTENSHEQ